MIQEFGQFFTLFALFITPRFATPRFTIFRLQYFVCNIFYQKKKVYSPALVGRLLTEFVKIGVVEIPTSSCSDIPAIEL